MRSEEQIEAQIDAALDAFDEKTDTLAHKLSGSEWREWSEVELRSLAYLSGVREALGWVVEKIGCPPVDVGEEPER